MSILVGATGLWRKRKGYSTYQGYGYSRQINARRVGRRFGRMAVRSLRKRRSY